MHALPMRKRRMVSVVTVEIFRKRLALASAYASAAGRYAGKKRKCIVTVINATAWSKQGGDEVDMHLRIST
jgi:hypothetical protein